MFLESSKHPHERVGPGLVVSYRVQLVLRTDTQDFLQPEIFNFINQPGRSMRRLG
jgi:hypothetical protein